MTKVIAISPQSSAAGECPVCLTAEERVWAMLPCGHGVCHACLQQLVREQVPVMGSYVRAGQSSCLISMLVSINVPVAMATAEAACSSSCESRCAGCGCHHAVLNQMR